MVLDEKTGIHQSVEKQIYNSLRCIALSIAPSVTAALKTIWCLAQPLIP